WQHPDFGHFAVASSEYPALHHHFYQITINNTYHNSNRNQEVQGQPELGWNQFKEDGVVVVEDSRTNDLLLGALSGTNQRVAKLANHLFGKHFALADDGTWYCFNGVVWKQDKNRRALADENKFLWLFVQAKAAFENPATQVVNRDRKVNKIQDVINKLETAAFKNAVIEELGSMVTQDEQFGETPFVDLLDRNRDLIAFTNGVYDLEANEFREARADDYLRKTVGYSFDPSRNPETESRIHDFFNKVFPDSDVKVYVLKFLASCLAGHTKDQLFHFGHGSGSNGKGVLNNLMAHTLGQYAAVVDASFLCSKLNKDPDAPTPTLTKL
ncbi:hypothetical protein HK102_008414, partial [Quaeritorhiza haematococci]